MARKRDDDYIAKNHEYDRAGHSLQAAAAFARSTEAKRAGSGQKKSLEKLPPPSRPRAQAAPAAAPARPQAVIPRPRADVLSEAPKPAPKESTGPVPRKKPPRVAQPGEGPSTRKSSGPSKKRQAEKKAEGKNLFKKGGWFESLRQTNKKVMGDKKYRLPKIGG